MDWLEVTIFTSAEGIEPVCGNLYQLGITGVEIEDEADFKNFLEENHQYWDYVDDELVKEKEKETCVKAYVSDNASGNEVLLSIREAMRALKEFDKDNAFGRLEISVGNMSEEDWANNWKKFFHPIKVGKKILIKPEWEELTEETDRTVFNIDPGMTFGTGSHYTTQLCIEELEKYVDETKNVLDLGCGSGILSLISIMLGAKSALAADIDPNCASVVKSNAEKNNIDKDKIEVLSGNIITDEKLQNYIAKNKYPLIYANIVADVIIGILPLVKKCIADDGIFITSGIIEDRVDDVKKALKENGFAVKEIKKRKDWVCMVCTVKKNGVGSNITIHNVGVSDGAVSYNSYLITGEKNILIDTVPEAYADKLINNIQKIAKTENIDYFILNHTEQDRSGALKKLLKLNKNAVVAATLAGLKNIEEQINCDFKSLLIKNNSELKIDSQNSLKFIITHNMNWPDSMMTYYEREGILFSCDGFSKENRENGLYEYYKKHLSPLNEYVYNAAKLLKQYKIKKIYPGSGSIIINADDAIEAYCSWSRPHKGRKKKITLIYASESGNTKKAAEYAKKFFEDKNNIKFTVIDAQKEDEENILERIYASAGVIFASPTINRNMHDSVANILFKMNHFKIRNKLFASFGSYGWSGEAPKLIYSVLKARHFTTYNQPFKFLFAPDNETYDEFDVYLNGFYEKVMNL
ncbi:MAG: 50S ribosomal protein L11 methyltransferase [Clostridia bacterium]|nr:50S ribosomal protein L11 methyltransferase [Clostridia bacterium]